MLQSTSWISLLLTARHGCCCSGTVLNSFLVSVQQLIPSSCSNGLKSHIYLCHLVFVCCCFVCFLARLISSTLMQPFTLLVLLIIFPSFIVSSLHCIVDLHESACPLIFFVDSPFTFFTAIMDASSAMRRKMATRCVILQRALILP